MPSFNLIQDIVDLVHEVNPITSPKFAAFGGVAIVGMHLEMGEIEEENLETHRKEKQHGMFAMFDLPTHGNGYWVLIGPSGIGKEAVIRVVKTFAPNVLDYPQGPKQLVKLWSDLKGDEDHHVPSVFVYGELAQLLILLSKQYAGGMTEMFLQCWDGEQKCSWGGVDSFPCPSIFGGTVEENMTRDTTRDRAMNGLLNRLAFCEDSKPYPSKLDPNHAVIRPRLIRNAINKIRSELARIDKVRWTITASDEMLHETDNWVDDQAKKLGDVNKIGYPRRARDYWLKFMAIFAVNDWLARNEISGDVITVKVSQDAFDQAKRLMEQSYRVSLRLLSGVGERDATSVVRKMLEKQDPSRDLDWSETSNLVHVGGSDNFRHALYDLYENKKICVYEDSNTSGKKICNKGLHEKCDPDCQRPSFPASARPKVYGSDGPLVIDVLKVRKAEEQNNGAENDG